MYLDKNSEIIVMQFTVEKLISYLVSRNEKNKGRVRKSDLRKGETSNLYIDENVVISNRS